MALQCLARPRVLQSWDIILNHKSVHSQSHFQQIILAVHVCVWHIKHITSVNKWKAAWVKSCFFTSEPCARPLKAAQQLSMFESPDAICFSSPIQPPPTNLHYNPSPRNIICGPANSHFFIPLSAHSTDSLIYPHPNKAFGCSWCWYASGGSIVAAHCGNHNNMNADPTFFNFMCAQYKMRNLAWWVQIMRTGLVASLVTGIPKHWGSKSIMSNDGFKKKTSNDHWLLHSAMCAAQFICNEMILYSPSIQV